MHIGINTWFLNALFTVGGSSWRGRFQPGRRLWLSGAVLVWASLALASHATGQGEASPALKPATHAAFGQRVYRAWVAGKPVPQLTAAYPQANLADGYAAQAAFAKRVKAAHGLGGYKAGVVTPAGQKQLGIDGPLVGVLPGDGVKRAAAGVTIALSSYPQRMIETEIGYRFTEPITKPVASVAALRKRVAAVLGVLEVPGGKRVEAKPLTPADSAAANVMGKALVIGEAHKPDAVDPNALQITLRHNGQVINQAQASAAAGGQYATLRQAVNRLVRNGYTIQPDHVVTNGALGEILPLKPGTYRADYQTLGTVSFEVIE
jgi:2-keto-4-pentenoate hydratase